MWHNSGNNNTLVIDKASTKSHLKRAEQWGNKSGFGNSKSTDWLTLINLERFDIKIYFWFVVNKNQLNDNFLLNFYLVWNWGLNPRPLVQSNEISFSFKLFSNIFLRFLSRLVNKKLCHGNFLSKQKLLKCNKTDFQRKIFLLGSIPDWLDSKLHLPNVPKYFC